MNKVDTIEHVQIREGKPTVGLSPLFIFEGTEITGRTEQILRRLAHLADIYVALPEGGLVQNDVAMAAQSVDALCAFSPPIKRNVRWGTLTDVLTDPDVEVFYTVCVTPVVQNSRVPTIRLKRWGGHVGLLEILRDVEVDHYRRVTLPGDPDPTGLLKKLSECVVPTPEDMARPIGGTRGKVAQVKSSDDVKRERPTRSPERTISLLSTLNPSIIDSHVISVARDAALLLKEAIDAGVWSKDPSRS